MKYRTLILGGLPIFFITAEAIGILSHLFYGMNIKALGMLFSPAAYPIYVLGFILLKFLGEIGIIDPDALLRTEIFGHSTLTYIAFLIPLLVYIFMFLLFLVSCRYYLRGDIKKYGTVKVIMYMLWGLMLLLNLGFFTAEII